MDAKARWTCEDGKRGMSEALLAIVWHSRTGAARAAAEAIAQGVGKTALMLAAADVTPDRLLTAKGYVFVCPENLATMSGVMKDMFDRCYYPLLGQVEGRAYATVVTAGSDGSGAQAQIDRIVTGWRLRRVAEPMIINCAAQTPEAILAPKTLSDTRITACNALGEGLAEGLRQGIF